MKTSIIYLGVFALTIFTSCKAESGFKNEFFSQNKQVVTNLFLGKEQNENLATIENSRITLLKDGNGAIEETPVSSMTTTSSRPIEEVIAEDNLITESMDDESQFVPFDKSVLKIIAEDNKIIENTDSDQFNSLDFEFINQNIMPNINVKLGIINLNKTDIKY